ncbi:MAG: hypothetical protein WKG01_19340 [Kofleriaceae bacterium]
MTLAEELRNLLAQAEGKWPTATELRTYLEPRAKAIAVAGEKLEHPAWANSVSGRHDMFLTLDDDVTGIQLYDDSRGWGAYAVLAVANGTLDEVESIVGETSWVPRNPGGGGAHDTVAAYPKIDDRTVRVFVHHLARRVSRVIVHFET